MLPSSSTPSSTRSSDEHIDHIIRDEITAGRRHSLRAWGFKGAFLVSANGSSFGGYSGRRLPLPFWQKVLMTVRGRGRKITTGDAEAEYDGLSSSSLLNGEHTHTAYRLLSSTYKAAHWISLRCLAMLGSIICLFGIVHLVNILINLGPILYEDETYDIRSRLTGLSYDNAGLLDYPTDFTRDIKPLPCHSHNDYWRRIPLFEAISYGCVGVEADVWLFPDSSDQLELYVGHNTAALTPERTFHSLYVDPLVRILDRANSPATLVVSHDAAQERPNGVWDIDPNQTLVLLVDFKTNGEKLWPVVQSHLEPLRSRGYLTHWNGVNVVEGPVTVVATGSVPFDLLTANTTYRDVFFDAPLAMLYEEPDPLSGIDASQRKVSIPTAPTSGEGTTGLPPDTTADTFNSSNSYSASVSFPKAVGYGHLFRSRPTAYQLHLLRGQIQGAKNRGLKPRYWGTPSWPIATRNMMWEVLVDEGVGFLNVDDLQAAASWDWRTRRHRTWLWK